jgi:hypothetical protein
VKQLAVVESTTIFPGNNAVTIKSPILRSLLLIVVLMAACLAASGQNADDRYPFGRDDKVGFIDPQGHEVIPPRFSNAGDTAHFNNGLAPVFEAGKGSGYIDPSGNYVIGPTQIWGWGRPFHEGIAGVLIWNKSGNRAGWIDRGGRLVFSGMGSEGTYFSDGLMSMRGPNGKWGFVDRYFQFVIPPQFDLVFEFSEGRAEVAIGHKSGFIDKSGKVVVPLKYDMVWPFQTVWLGCETIFPSAHGELWKATKSLIAISMDLSITMATK